MSCRKTWYGMNCKEAEKIIPYFLQDDLDGRDLAEFVEHIDECHECMEELSIQFLVAEGMEQLEIVLIYRKRFTVSLPERIIRSD